MEGLETRLTELFGSYDGIWSVYVKDLTNDKEFQLNSQPLYSASLIKALLWHRHMPIWILFFRAKPQK